MSYVLVVGNLDKFALIFFVKETSLANVKNAMQRHHHRLTISALITPPIKEGGISGIKDMYGYL
jgi:hypothetical protein